MEQEAERERAAVVMRCCKPGGACYEAGLADVRHTYEPSPEVAQIVAWLREQSGEGDGLFQMRNLTFQIAANEFADAIESGDHLEKGKP